MLKWGGMAEQVVAEATHCIRIPRAMPYEDGAAFIMGFGTSYHALKQRGLLKPGETLLVLGASGGVGLAAVELGNAMGARVVSNSFEIAHIFDTLAEWSQDLKARHFPI